MKRNATRNAAFMALAAVMISAMLIGNTGNASSPLAASPAQASAPNLAAANPGQAQTLVVRLPFHNSTERDQLATKWGAVGVSTLGGYLTIWTDQSGYN